MSKALSINRTEEDIMNINSTSPDRDDVNLFVAGFVHVRRWLWDEVDTLKPLSNELKKLEALKIENTTLLSYYVWRRSLLLVSIPLLMFDTAMGLMCNPLFGIYNQEWWDDFNAWGRLLASLHGFEGLILLMATITAFFKWATPKYSAKVLGIGWLVAFLVPLFPAFFHVAFLLEDNATDTPEEQAKLVGKKFMFSLRYALELIPYLFSLSNGTLSAAIYMRLLFPYSALVGWLVVLAAPFVSLLLLLAMVIITQVLGGPLFFVGIFFVFAGPWVFVVRRKSLTDSFEWSPEKRKQVKRTSSLRSLCTYVGYAILLIWALTADIGGVSPVGSNGDDSAVLSYSEFVWMILEALSRFPVTTLLFNDIFVRMTLRNWQSEQKRRDIWYNARVEGNPCDLDNVISAFDAAYFDENTNTTNGGKKAQDETEKVVEI